MTRLSRLAILRVRLHGPKRRFRSPLQKPVRHFIVRIDHRNRAPQLPERRVPRCVSRIKMYWTTLGRVARSGLLPCGNAWCQIIRSLALPEMGTGPSACKSCWVGPAQAFTSCSATLGRQIRIQIGRAARLLSE